jgi:hypothetical protein
LSTYPLIVAGLALARQRALVVLFGLGGLSLLLAPSAIGLYVGRYSVPVAGPMLASAVIAAHAFVERAKARKTP